MSDRLHALIFNALTEGLADADRFVSLTEREAITSRIVAVVRDEQAAELARRDADADAMDRHYQGRSGERWEGP
jgi:hypothetical protein